MTRPAAQTLFRPITVCLLLILATAMHLAQEQTQAQSPTIPDVDYPAITPTNVADLTLLAGIQADAGFTDVAWTRSSTVLVATTSAGPVHLYRTFALDMPPTILEGHSAGLPLLSLAINSEDRLLATGSADGTVRLWNIDTGRAEGALELGDWVWALDFHPTDPAVLAVGTGDGSISLWDASGERRIASLAPTHDDTVTSVRFAPDGATLWTASLDGTVRQWEIANNELALNIDAHAQGVSALVLDPEADTLATASGDTTIRLWAADNLAAAPAVLEGHIGGISSLSFNADGTLLASAGQDSAIRIWDTASGDLLHVRTENAVWVQGVAFTSDGTLLASVDLAGGLNVWGVVE